MTTHRIKFKGRDLCDAVYARRKVHEIRLNDRNYQEGDFIEPIALDDDLNPIEHLINNVTYKVGFVSTGRPGIEDGYCVFTLLVERDLNVTHHAQNVLGAIENSKLITQEVE